MRNCYKFLQTAISFYLSPKELEKEKLLFEKDIKLDLGLEPSLNIENISQETLIRNLNLNSNINSLETTISENNRKSIMAQPI